MTEQDPLIDGHGTSTRKMICTHASGIDGTIHISQAHDYLVRVINVRKDGGKCELVATEHDPASRLG